METLTSYGLTTMAKFAAITDTTEDRRDILKNDFNMDSKTGYFGVKAKAAAIIVAWDTARKRADKVA